MESFDTNIDNFDGLNRCQQNFFLPLESGDLSLLNQELKNN
jgi:hypothetical protein